MAREPRHHDGETVLGCDPWSLAIVGESGAIKASSQATDPG